MRPITVLMLFAFLAASAQVRETATNPKLVHRVEPEYTDEARAAKLEGIVTVYLEVDEQGKPDRVALLQGIGLGLDEKAVEAVKQWRFEPAMSKGEARRTAAGVEVRFRLPNEHGWRIRQAAYQVARQDAQRREPIVKPVLAHYTRPAIAGCGGDGLVRVQMNIGKDGRPAEVHVFDRNSAMANAVETAAKDWTFEAARGSGEPRDATASFLLECPSAAAPADGAPASKLVPGVVAPVFVSKVEPDYPEAARKIKHQGTVRLNLEIDSAGVPSNLRIAEMAGYDLDFAAMEAVKAWRFIPGRKDGRPVRVLTTLDINFRLL
jgi:TonB family protein